jgi:hypothetical protein
MGAALLEIFDGFGGAIRSQRDRADLRILQHAVDASGRLLLQQRR